MTMLLLDAATADDAADDDGDTDDDDDEEIDVCDNYDAEEDCHKDCLDDDDAANTDDPGNSRELEPQNYHRASLVRP